LAPLVAGLNQARARCGCCVSTARFAGCIGPAIGSERTFLTAPRGGRAHL
jgi:hypothetical protein